MTGIGEAARQSGLGIETIRFYEREGIVPVPGRAANGRRVYSPSGIARLRFLKTCRALGFGLEESRALLGLSERADADCDAGRALGEAHLRTVRLKLAELQRLERALAELVANCEAGKPSCPLLDGLRQA